MNSRTVLSDIVAIFTIAFAKRFPEVNLRVIQHNPFDIQQGLEEGAFDVAISYLADKPQRYRFYHPLYTQEYYLLMRKGSKFVHHDSITWDEVKSLPLCLFPAETHIFGTEVYETLGDAHPGVPRLETNAMMVLLDHVRTGKWVSILPKPVLFMIAGSDELEAFPLPLTAEAGTIGIVVPHSEPESHLAEAFFQIATSPDILAKFHEFFQPNTASRRR